MGSRGNPREARDFFLNGLPDSHAVNPATSAAQTIIIAITAPWTTATTADAATLIAARTAVVVRDTGHSVLGESCPSN
jgi:hypothetical protein